MNIFIINDQKAKWVIFEGMLYNKANNNQVIRKMFALRKIRVKQNEAEPLERSSGN